MNVLRLDVDEVSTGGVRAAGISATLDLGSQPEPAAEVSISRAQLASPIGELRNVEVKCGVVVVRGGRQACEQATFAARGGPTGTLRFGGNAVYDGSAGTLEVRGSGLAIADGRARFTVRSDARGWSVSVDGTQLASARLRELASPWLQLPEDITVEGPIDLHVDGRFDASRTRLEARIDSTGLGFTNEDGTYVGEGLAGTTALSIELTGERTRFDARLEANAGQSLAGMVLLDFGANPATLEARGELAGDGLRIESFTLAQRDLLQARGEARLRLGDTPGLATGRIEIERLQFPAAYASFLQIALAATDFGALTTRGQASGAIELTENRPVSIDARLENLDLEDARQKFSMLNVNGRIHWSPEGRSAPEVSHLEWQYGSAYGLSGGAARIDFRIQGMGFELVREARLPIFDGALRVSELAIRRFGSSDAELDFAARIEPISMPLLSRAFGWPEMQGQLAGSIPGVTYRDGLLAVEGDLIANVFDGTIVASGLRLRDPLGPWPRLYADVRARRLDLELVTRTFPIGTITGRLDGDILGLELFNWSPVAFDARLFSTPGDRSRRRISQKAVTSISSIGGGGGTVTAALQSGVLRFFDDFNYDRIGISCRLQNEVCLMGGIERPGGGYYLVKGRGLPRIDVVGSEGRVDWPVLVSQIVNAMRSEGPSIR